MVEILNKGKPFDQRIRDRLRPSGDHSDQTVKTGGDAPNRVITQIHHTGNVRGSTTQQKDKG